MVKWIGSCVLPFFGIVLFFSCGDKADPVTPLPPDGGNGLVTYTMNVKAILDQHCILCHSTANSGVQRNGAPLEVNFNTYQVAVDHAEHANERIQAGTMPPTGGIPADQRAIFARWLQDGTPE